MVDLTIIEVFGVTGSTACALSLRGTPFVVSYVSGITLEISGWQLWDKVKKTSEIYAERPLPILETNGVIITDPKDVASTLASSFAGVSSSNMYPEPFHKLKAKKKQAEF